MGDHAKKKKKDKKKSEECSSSRGLFASFVRGKMGDKKKKKKKKDKKHKKSKSEKHDDDYDSITWSSPDHKQKSGKSKQKKVRMAAPEHQVLHAEQQQQQQPHIYQHHHQHQFIPIQQQHGNNNLQQQLQEEQEVVVVEDQANNSLLLEEQDDSLTQQDSIEQLRLELDGQDSIEQHRKEYEEIESLIAPAQDAIEIHRDVFEEAQLLKLHEWYEEESLAADLESLKRKPWYQKIKAAEEQQQGNSTPAVEPSRQQQQQEQQQPRQHSYSGTPRTAPAVMPRVPSEPQQPVVYEVEDDDDDDDETGIDCDVSTLVGTKLFPHQEEEDESDGEEEEEEDDDDESEADETAESTESSSSSEEEEDSQQVANEAYFDALGRQDGIHLDFSRLLPVSRPVIPLEQDRERLEYARRSVERMKRIEELRQEREEYRSRMEELKWRRRYRYELIKSGKLLPSSSNIKKRRGKGTLMKEDVSILSDPEPFLLVDLTNVCEDPYRSINRSYTSSSRLSNQHQQYTPRQGETLMSFRAQGFQGEIPVIVDLVNHKKPQQILDLTNIEEPPFLLSDDELSRNVVKPLTPNERLDYLRRDREEKLYQMTRRYQDVMNKKISPRGRRDEALSAYQRLMERVTRNVRTNVCY